VEKVGLRKGGDSKYPLVFSVSSKPQRYAPFVALKTDAGAGVRTAR
jgi:hypothetical protein